LLAQQPPQEISFEIERRAPMPQGQAARPSRELQLDDHAPAQFEVMEIAARRAPSAPIAAQQTPISQFPPSNAARHGPRPIVQPEEARAVAGIPQPPTGLFDTPGYAHRARKWQNEIAGQVRQAQAAADEAALVLEHTLIAIAERARPPASAMLAYRRPLERLSMLEQRMRATDPHLALNLDGLRAVIVPIDEQIAATEREIAALKQQERQVNEELTRTEASIYRAKAKQSLATVMGDGTHPRSPKR
jgi:hypothetical protein